MVLLTQGEAEISLFGEARFFLRTKEVSQVQPCYKLLSQTATVPQNIHSLPQHSGQPKLLGPVTQSSIDGAASQLVTFWFFDACFAATLKAVFSTVSHVAHKLSFKLFSLFNGRKGVIH